MENYETSGYSVYARNKKIAILIAAAVIILTAPAPQIFGKNSAAAVIIYYLSAIVANIVVFAWVYYDSLERNQPLNAGQRLLTVLFGLFALIFYLFKTRGFTRGLLAIGWIVLIFLGVIIGSGVIAAIVFLIIGAK